MPGRDGTANRAGQFARSAAISAILMATVCVAVPFAIYAGNRAEFSASFPDVLAMYLPYVLVLILAFAVLGAVMPARAFERYFGVLAALAVLTWLQGSLLVWDYGQLDGRSIPWFEDAWKGVLDLSLWTVVLVSAYRLPKFRRVVSLAAAATLGIQAAAIVVTAVPRADELLVSSFATTDAAGRGAIARFSADRNVLHVVMDGFQSDIFREILEEEGGGGLKEQLDGFTFFRDNLGVFPYTQMAVPALLSGKIYRNHMPAEDFVAGTLRGRTILSAASEYGYEVDIAAPVPLKNVYGLVEHTHSYGITANSHATRDDYTAADSAKLADLSLFRVVPHFAKALVHRDELWVFQGRGRSREYLHLQYFADLQFLRQLRDEMTADRDVPVYKMLHVMLSHRPTVGSGDCVFDGIHATTRAAVKNQARCGLIGVLRILERMRELGIYDSSLIVLMADHGAWVPADGVTGQPGAGTTGAEVAPETIGMAIPVLAVKPPGASGELRISGAPTSIIDVPATISALLGLNARFDGIPAFENRTGTTRERHHLTYAYGKNPEHEDYYYAMREYVVEGSVFDATAWRATGIFRPAGHYETLGADANRPQR